MSRTKNPEINLPYPLFDSHFHLDHMAQRGLDITDLWRRLRAAGLTGGLDVSVTEAGFEERRVRAVTLGGLHLSAGIHPSGCGSGRLDDRMDAVADQTSDTLVVAVGESGLDFYRDTVPEDRQQEAFAAHLDLAAEKGLPIIVHNRNADDAVLAAIGGSPCRRGVFHCFSSDSSTARKALDLGFHVSFAGNLTYKASDEIRRAAAMIPDDRLLVETDAPFLPPQAVRGRTNHPGFIGYTLEVLAEIRGTAPEDLAARTRSNAASLFGI